MRGKGARNWRTFPHGARFGQSIWRGRVQVPPRTTELANDAFREPRDQSARHAALFERIASRIYGYFARTVRDRTEAEELAQRTLVELERSLREQSYDPARSFNVWMWLKAHT